MFNILNFQKFFKDLFWMWTIFKVFVEFVTILLLFYGLVLWPRGMWDFSSPVRYWTRTPCIERQSLNHRTTREVLGSTFLPKVVRWVLFSRLWASSEIMNKFSVRIFLPETSYSYPAQTNLSVCDFPPFLKVLRILDYLRFLSCFMYMYVFSTHWRESLGGI